MLNYDPPVAHYCSKLIFYLQIIIYICVDFYFGMGEFCTEGHCFDILYKMSTIEIECNQQKSNHSENFAQIEMCEEIQGPLLLTWFNFNPSMDFK